MLRSDRPVVPDSLKNVPTNRPRAASIHSLEKGKLASFDMSTQSGGATDSCHGCQIHRNVKQTPSKACEDQYETWTKFLTALVHLEGSDLGLPCGLRMSLRGL